MNPTILLGQRARAPDAHREVDMVAGCGSGQGQGGIVFLQQTDTPSTDLYQVMRTVVGGNVLAACYGTQDIGYTAKRHGTPGIADACDLSLPTIGGFSTNATLNTVLTSAGPLIVWETAPGECDDYNCPAGLWLVPQSACGSINATWDQCVIQRVNSSGVPQETIGNAFGSFSLATGGGTVNTFFSYLGTSPADAVQVAVVHGSAVTFAAGDRVVITLFFIYSNSQTERYVDACGNCYNPAGSGGGGTSCESDGGYVGSGTGGCSPCTPHTVSGPGVLPYTSFYSGPQFARNQVITTPMFIKGTPPPRGKIYPALLLRKGSGSGSGATRDLYGIAGECGDYRMAKLLKKGSGSGSGATRDLYGVADCCPSPEPSDTCVQGNCSGGTGAVQFSFPTPSHLNVGNDTTFVAYRPNVSGWAGPPLPFGPPVYGCTWVGQAYTPYCAGASRGVWLLILTSPTTIELAFSVFTCGYELGHAIFKATFASWDCESPLTLDLDPTSVDGIGWVMSITITPA